MVRYPDDSIQAFTGSWWRTDASRQLRVGRLLRAYVPYLDATPFVLEVEGATDPTRHDRVRVRAERLVISAPPRPSIPVAGLPMSGGEVYVVQRAKRRPVLVVGVPSPEAPRTRTSARWQVQPTVLVAPYYGRSADGGRGGWHPALVERIRRCEYPQYLWDRLPIEGADESILRLDQIQPIGRDPSTYEATPYCLADEAVAVLDDWLRWLLTGRLREDGPIHAVRADLIEMAAQEPGREALTATST